MENLLKQIQNEQDGFYFRIGMFYPRRRHEFKVTNRTKYFNKGIRLCLKKNRTQRKIGPATP